MLLLLLFLSIDLSAAKAYNAPHTAHYKHDVQRLQDEAKQLIAQEGKDVSNSLGLSSKTCPSKKTNTPDSSQPKDYQLLLFASFSMPKSSLKQLSVDLQKSGGRLILRGLINDSFRATAQKIQTLGIVADIDPPLFEQFNVNQVPTFILAKVQDNELLTTNCDRIAGNVTLQHVLEQFAERGELHSISAHLLKSLRTP